MSQLDVKAMHAENGAYAAAAAYDRYIFGNVGRSFNAEQASMLAATAAVEFEEAAKAYDELERPTVAKWFRKEAAFYESQAC